MNCKKFLQKRANAGTCLLSSKCQEPFIQCEKCETIPPWTNSKLIRVYTALPGGLLTQVELQCDSNPESVCSVIKGEHLFLPQSAPVAKEEM